MVRGVAARLPVYDSPAGNQRQRPHVCLAGAIPGGYVGPPHAASKVSMSTQLPALRHVATAFAAVYLTAASPTPADVDPTKGVTVRDGGVEAGELATMARALVALRQAESSASTTRSGEALRSLLTARQQHATRPGAAGKAATAGFAVHWNRRNGTPTFVDLSPRRASAKAAAPAGAAALDQAYEFIETHRNLFRLREPRAELNLRAIESGPGTRHVRMQQVYEGLPLWGHEIVLHFDAGGLYALNGRYAPTPRLDFALEPALDRDDALAAVRDHLGQAAFVTLDEGMRRLLRYDGPDTGLCLWRRDGHATSRLAWHVEIRPNMRDRWVYFVDALSGSILERYNATMTDGPAGGRGTDLFGTARDLQVYESGGSFFMLDASRSIFADFQPDLFGAPRGALITLDAGAEDFRTGTNLTYVGSATNDWTDPVSVSAHSNTARVFEYYQDVHGRDSFDDRGGTLISVVHVTDDGASMGNAFWNGTLIAYGDGNAAFNPLAGSLDIAAHEITHGVIERTVNLEYRFESGALNESIADIFGVMLDRDDWRIGEEVVKSRFFCLCFCLELLLYYRQALLAVCSITLRLMEHLFLFGLLSAALFMVRLVTGSGGLRSILGLVARVLRGSQSRAINALGMLSLSQLPL